MEGIPHIEPYKKRHDELESDMGNPAFFQDQRRAATISREHQKLAGLIELYTLIEKVYAELGDTRELMEDKDADDELKELAEMELPELEEKYETLKQEILIEMIPPDPSDSRNTIVEIRAGAGGDEASLFAGDLSRMYHRLSELNKWKIEPMSSSASEVGGFKEVCFLVTGVDVYKKLRYESGVHRVQRIPTTESGGRIHTSTVTVAMMPEAEAVDVDINPQDLEIMTMRASGAGGQHVNTTDSAVRIVHIPTGEMVYCADERSQLKNKDKAMKVLYSRLLEKKEREEQAKYAAQRKSQVGTGDRSERIRTYNFPQGRVTDHRIGLTLHTLPALMEGDVEPLLVALKKAAYAEKLEDLFEGNLGTH